MIDDPRGSVESIESGIIVRDPDAMIEFCRSVFAFEVTESVHVPGIGRLVRLRRGGAHIKLFAPDIDVEPARVLDDATWQSPGGWRYVTICLDSAAAVDETARRATASGGRIFRGPYEYRPGNYVVVIADVEENVWEIICREDSIP
jgi:catechol 2,3-dioxygenase-like lactoylglutathione lyase family enzyme